MARYSRAQNGKSFGRGPGKSKRSARHAQTPAAVRASKRSLYVHSGPKNQKKKTDKFLYVSLGRFTTGESTLPRKLSNLKYDILFVQFFFAARLE